MKSIVIVAFIVLCIAIAAIVVLLSKQRAITSKKKQMNNVQPITIQSPAFAANQEIPAKYTCDGANVNPPLTFTNIPENAKSLVLIVDDPDAPAKTWVHWIIYNIPPQTTSVDENSVPQNAKLGTTDFGKSGYGGPCPPSGTHRYFFKVYALDAMFEDLKNPAKDVLEQKMQGHIVGQGELVGLYKRK